MNPKKDKTLMGIWLTKPELDSFKWSLKQVNEFENKDCLKNDQYEDWNHARNNLIEILDMASKRGGLNRI